MREHGKELSMVSLWRQYFPGSFRPELAFEIRLISSYRAFRLLSIYYSSTLLSMVIYNRTSCQSLSNGNLPPLFISFEPLGHASFDYRWQRIKARMNELNPQGWKFAVSRSMLFFSVKRIHLWFVDTVKLIVIVRSSVAGLQVIVQINQNLGQGGR